MMGLKLGLFTFLASLLITLPSETASSRVHPVLAVLFIVMAVAGGVGFDILGLAVATAAAQPFHAMNSKKIAGARHSLALLRERGRVQSFCSDVAGDISSIVSGSLGSALAIRLARNAGSPELLLVVLTSGAIAAATVGGKAGFKWFALNRSGDVVRWAGRVLFYVERMSGISLLGPRNKGRGGYGRTARNKRTRDTSPNGRNHRLDALGQAERAGRSAEPATRGPRRAGRRDTQCHP